MILSFAITFIIGLSATNHKKSPGKIIDLVFFFLLLFFFFFLLGPLVILFLLFFFLLLLFGALMVPREKLMEYLLCVFVVFAIFGASFFMLRPPHHLSSLLSYPWIISVEPIPNTVDNWWMTLRFLDYEVLKCWTHEILLSNDPSFSAEVLVLFASNLLTGTVGFITGIKLPSLVKSKP